ncbi:hypothetical protein [Lewinella sp. IMCC34191]|uniref:hypothetical protein n=1 Tax=Lewinella sp. IMCC34191 TaxID=2259172 RepID=UPI0013009E43|nr:hypothetical protein [Lewinella sp. IMCC34191]
MKILNQSQLSDIYGGLPPLAWFLIGYAVTYAGCALTSSEDAHKGINDGNGNCDDQ